MRQAVGIYNFRSGKSFVESAERMISLNQRTNGEIVAPCYNSLVQDSKKIGIYNIGSEGNGMHGLGIPSDLDAFLSLDISRRRCK